MTLGIPTQSTFPIKLARTHQQFMLAYTAEIKEELLRKSETP